MRKTPTSQELKGMIRMVINRRFGEEWLIMYCRNNLQRDGQEHQALARIIHCCYDMTWNFLQIMSWCLRYACGEEVPEKLDMLLGLESSGSEEDTKAKLDLFDNLAEIVEWLKIINARCEARQADLHDCG